MRVPTQQSREGTVCVPLGQLGGGKNCAPKALLDALPGEAGTMIHRWTLWEDPLQAGELQLSLALLDDDWEPLYEQTLPCGPFHDREERRLELLDNARRWLRQYGVQERLAGL